MRRLIAGLCLVGAGLASMYFKGVFSHYIAGVCGGLFLAKIIYEAGADR